VKRAIDCVAGTVLFCPDPRPQSRLVRLERILERARAGSADLPFAEARSLAEGGSELLNLQKVGQKGGEVGEHDRNLAAASDGSLNWGRSGPLEHGEMKRATYEDVLNAPENMVAEILDGELVLSPRPAPRHAVAASALVGLLHPAFHRGHGGPGGWWILSEPELHLADQVLVPDLAGWRRERMAVLPGEAFFPLAPDWVCEVLSPSTERIDRTRKLRMYAAAGVGHAWLVNAVERTLEILRLREGAWTIVGVLTGLDVVRAEPFDAVDLELGALWADPPASR
jgi:Uma2 family endonuclease